MIWFLAVFSAALYVNTLTHHYALDDALMITENSFTKKGLAAWKDIMTQDAFTGFFGKQKKLVAGGRYRPLSQLMFAAEYELAGLSPFTGHLLNILLYSLSTVVLFLILRKILSSFHHTSWYRSVPFIAALLFACHPLHTEVVANIKGRDEILSLLASLLSLYFSLRYAGKRNPVHLILLFVVFFLALLAKENAITFLAVIPLTLYFFSRASVRDHLPVAAVLLAGMAAYFVLRYHALGYLTSSEPITEILNDPYANSSLSAKLATNTLTWGIYLKLLVLPWPLTHDYYPWHIQLTTWADPRVLITLLAYAGLTLAAIRGLRKKTPVSYAVLFFFITFSISSNLVFNIGTFMNERFMFIPLLGFTLGAGWLIREKAIPAAGRSGHHLARGLIAGTALIFSVLTIIRNSAWKDDFTLFTTDVKTSVNSTKCNVSAGGMYLNRARTLTDSSAKAVMLNDAERHLRKALEIYPGNSAGWVLLGNVYLERKDYPRATEYYVSCLNVHNTQTEALSKLKYTALAAGNKGLYETGILGLKALIRFQPKETDHYIQLADQLSKHQQAPEAVRLMDSLIAAEPGFADAYSKLGEIYGRVYQDLDRSLALLLKAYSMDPANSSTVENIGVCYGFMGQYGKSLEFFNKAYAIDSTSARTLTNLGNTYHLMGETRKAQQFFRRAAEAAKKEP